MGQWPERFLKAIKPGADLSSVGWRCQHWLLLDPKEGVIRFAREKNKENFKTVGGLLWDLALGKQISRSAAWSAESAAYERQGEKLLELLEAVKPSKKERKNGN